MLWKDYEERFNKKNIEAINWYEGELAKLRTGIITTSVIDHVKVNAYGSLTPINQVANISIPEPRVLIIKAYDPSLYKEIANAIVNANLNVNPQVDADKIRINFPPLTEDARKEMTKKAKAISEDAKVRIRRNRQDIHDLIKKDKELTEDDKKGYVNNLDKATKLQNENIEKLYEKKAKEILTI